MSDIIADNPSPAIDFADLPFSEKTYILLCHLVDEHGFLEWDREAAEEVARIAGSLQPLFMLDGVDRDEYDEKLYLAGKRVDATIADLVRAGRVEWVIRNGWPSVRVPDAWRDILSYDPHSPAKVAYEIWQRRLDDLAAMPYAEYLTTPEWRARRLIHMEQARERCQVCNRGRDDGVSLHVHHRTYERRGNERFSDLIVLCADCHQHFHKGNR